MINSISRATAGILERCHQFAVTVLLNMYPLLFLRLPGNSEVGQSDPARNGKCLRKAALLCFFPTSNCSKEKGFASSSLSHRLHPAATFILLMTNEECQRWISPHHVLYLLFGKLVIRHHTVLQESLCPVCFFSQVEGWVGF